MPTSSIADQLHSLDARPIIVASHRRSGTHLTIDLLRKQFPACRIHRRFAEPLHHLYLLLDTINATDPAVRMDDESALRIISRAPRPIVKTHFLFDDAPQLPQHWIQWLRDRATFIYIYRDGRDVLASLHLYMQSFDPSARIPFSQFIRQQDSYSSSGSSRPAAWADHIRHWLNVPNVIPVSYERIIHHTQQVLHDLAQALGQSPQMIRPLLPVKPTNIWQTRWQRFFARNPQNTAIVARYKRMKLVNWRTQMSPDDRRYFHEQAGDMLIQLGYESSDAWVTAANP